MAQEYTTPIKEKSFLSRHDIHEISHTTLQSPLYFNSKYSLTDVMKLSFRMLAFNEI